MTDIHLQKGESDMPSDHQHVSLLALWEKKLEGRALTTDDAAHLESCHSCQRRWRQIRGAKNRVPSPLRFSMALAASLVGFAVGWFAQSELIVRGGDENGFQTSAALFHDRNHYLVLTSSRHATVSAYEVDLILGVRPIEPEVTVASLSPYHLPLSADERRPDWYAALFVAGDIGQDQLQAIKSLVAESLDGGKSRLAKAQSGGDLDAVAGAVERELRESFANEGLSFQVAIVASESPEE